MTLFFCLIVSVSYAQTPISCGQVVNGSIATQGEKDTYTFTAQANDSITIRVVSNSSFFCNYLELFAPDGSNLAQAQNQIDRTLPLTGNYTIVVSDKANFFTGGYSLVWLRLNNPCAPTLNCAHLVTGSISANERFKFYSFSASANDFIIIRASGPSGGVCSYLELYAPNGANIATAQGQIDKKLTLTGTYTIIVRDKNNFFTDNYALTWLRLNNSCAPNLSCGQIVTGSISANERFKFYSFFASANDSITIRALGYLGLNRPYLELYAPDGTNLAKAQGQIDIRLSLTGTYTIIVRDASDFSTGNYALAWLRLNNPCALSIKFGQSITGSITNTESLKFYTFLAYANDFVTISIKKTSGNFYPYLELYAPDGANLSQARDRIDKILILTGPYTILLRDENNSIYNTGNYVLSLSRKNTVPSVGVITPSSGACSTEQSTSFTTTYSDPDSAGWQDIQTAYLLINTSTSGANCFWGYYDQNTDKLFLRNDANTAWLGGFTPGSNNIIENSYVKLDCSKTTVMGSGNTLSINWSVIFKFVFGNRTYNTYLYVKDDLNAVSGWLQKGTFRVDSIEFTSLLPVDKGRYIEGAIINCSVQAIPRNSLYQYQFLVDGQIKRSFSTNNSWNWQTTSQDIGIRILTVQLKNQYGTQIEKSRKLIIYRRPIEP